MAAWDLEPEEDVVGAACFGLCVGIVAGLPLAYVFLLMLR